MNNPITPQIIGWMLGVFTSINLGVMFFWMRSVKSDLKVHIDEEILKNKELNDMSFQQIKATIKRIESDMKCFRTKYEDHYKTYHSKKD